MLKAVCGVRDALLERCGCVPPVTPEKVHSFALKDITDIISNLTIIDEIVFVRYEAEPSNPIWGAFQRWARQPSAYSPFQTVVEVRYASHLDEEWRRFVVCKELCHALDTSEGSHVNTQNAVDNLVRQFALQSSSHVTANQLSMGFASEMLAEAGAMELLCPLPIRREALRCGMPVEDIASRFRVPADYTAAVCTDAYMNMMDVLFR